MAERVRSLKTDIKFKDTPIGKVPIDWNVVTLKNIASKFLNGGTPDTTRKEYWDGNIPWITGADFENQKVDQVRKYITKAGLQNSSSNLVEKGNLLVVTRTGVGKIAIAPFDIAISQDITGIYLDNNKASAAYVYWYLAYYADKLRKIIQGTSINGLLREDLGLFNLSLPPLAEQLKIAEIFATSDAAIEKTVQIIEKTKELKKGLMQNLLTRGIGHKIFKESNLGKIPEEWKIMKIKDVLLKTLNRDPAKTPDLESKYVDISAISNESYKIEKYQIIKGREAPSRARKEIKYNDIIYAMVRPYLKRLSLVPIEFDSEICSTGFCVLRCNMKIAKPKYIFYILQTKWMTKKLTDLQRGSNYPAVTEKDIYIQEIAFPSLNEQKTIVEILFSVDEEIDKEIKNKNDLEILKKGLMQILLTGKIRVNV